MELTKLKYAQNTGDASGLPGFEDGNVTLNGVTVVGNKPDWQANFADQSYKDVGSGLNFKLPVTNNTSSSGTSFLKKAGSFLNANAGGIATAATGVLDMVNGIGAASKFNRTADDLLQDAGNSQGNIGGVGYTVQNSINKKQIEQETNAEATSNTIGLVTKGASTGAAIGSLVGPVGSVIGGAVGAVGGFIGGLFGGASKKREMKKQMRLAEIKRINTNDFNRSGALTTVLQNNLAETEGDQTQQTLYAAAYGKESYSAGGPTSGYNARVSNGEIIANKFTGEMFRVPGIPNNKDGKLAFIRPSDTIISNKYGLSDYVAQTGDLEGGEAMQGTIMKALGKRGYKNGKLPGFKWGLPEWANLGVNAFGALSSMADANSIASEEISRPNTYSSNWLQGTALNTLKNLRSNVYPIIPEIYNQMGKGMYAINNAGGMGGGQRNLSRLAAMQSAYDTTAKLLQDAQDRNAKYQMAYADAAANLGNEEARRMMNAAQFDYNAYNQAHGAKRLMESQRKADAMNFLEQGIKGLTDMHMWRRMMNNYEQDSETDRAYKRYQMGLDKDGNKIIKDPFVHTSPFAIQENGGNPIYASQDDKINSAATSALNDSSYSFVNDLIQKQLSKEQKKKLKNKSTTQTASSSGGRLLNPQAMTNAVQRGANIGRQETPYWRPTQISDMLNYIMQNKFFLR